MPPLWRNTERAFWFAVAKEYTSEVAAMSVGAVQADETYWYRDRGDMPPFMLAQLKAGSSRLTNARKLLR